MVFKQIDIIHKFMEIDQNYSGFSFSSLERIILNSYKKYYYNTDLMSEYIINNSIKSMNRVYKTTKESNKGLRGLISWLSYKLNKYNGIDLISVTINL